MIILIYEMICGRIVGFVKHFLLSSFVRRRIFIMRDFNKFGPFGCGRIKAALRFSLNVSGCVLILTLGGRLSGSLGVLSNSDIVEIVSGVGRLWGSLGSRLVVREAQAAICFLPDCMDKADQVLSGNLSRQVFIVDHD